MASVHHVTVFSLLCAAACAFASPAVTPQRVQLLSIDLPKHFPLHQQLSSEDGAALREMGPVHFSVALQHRQGSIPRLEQLWLDVSNPHSENYGRYLTAEQVQELTALPQDMTLHTVKWLESHGISVLRRASNSLRCVASASAVESAFETSMRPLRSVVDGSLAWGVQGSVSIPRNMAATIELVTGLLPSTHQRERPNTAVPQLDRMSPLEKLLRKMQSAALSALQGRSGANGEVASAQGQAAVSDNPSLPSVPATNPVKGGCPASSPTVCMGASSGVYACCPRIGTCCPNVVNGSQCCTGSTVCCQGQCKQSCDDDPTDVYVTPSVLREQYRMADGERAPPAVQHSSYSHSVVAFGDQYTPGALDLFNAAMGEQDFTAVQRGVPSPACLSADPPCDQVESDLDIQYMSAMGSGVKQEFWANNGSVYTLAWAEDVLASPPPRPMVHSISYIDDEMNFAKTQPGYMQRSNAEFMKMGVLGMTILACSGDTGSPGWSYNFPIDPTGRNFPLPCSACPTTENLCNQVTIELTEKLSNGSTQATTCHLPSGLQSREPIGVASCLKVLKDPACAATMAAFPVVANNSEHNCGFRTYTDDAPDPVIPGVTPRLYSEHCNCSQLPVVTKTSGTSSCTARGYEYDPKNGPALYPLYPASSPYVTAVGATRLTSQNNALCQQRPIDRHIPAKTMPPQLTCPIRDVASNIATHSHITSGGGFSTAFQQPLWQTAAVQSYLNKQSPDKAVPFSGMAGGGGPLPPAFLGIYNTSNRAYPDVAIAGHHFLVARTLNGSSTECPCDFLPVDGTSCSSPTFAGIVSSINARLLAKGRPLLGPLNQLMYTMAAEFPQAFFDVTQGDNKCTESLCSTLGYEATTGFDLVTGLGSPNVRQWLSYLNLTR